MGSLASLGGERKTIVLPLRLSAIALLGLGALNGLAAPRAGEPASLAIYVTSDVPDRVPRAGLAAIANAVIAELAAEDRPLLAVTLDSPLVKRCIAEGSLSPTDLEPPASAATIGRLCQALEVDAFAFVTVRELTAAGKPAVLADVTWGDRRGRFGQSVVELKSGTPGFQVGGTASAAAVAQAAARGLLATIKELEARAPVVLTPRAPAERPAAVGPESKAAPAALAAPPAVEEKPSPPIPMVAPSATARGGSRSVTTRPTEKAEIVGGSASRESRLTNPMLGRRTAPPARSTYERALEAIRSARYEEAEALLREALQTEGEVAEYRLLLGDTYAARGQREAAEVEYGRAAAGDPTLAEPHMRLGKLYAERHQWQRAVQEFERALETDPRLMDARLRLAQLYRDHGQWDNAARELRAAVELDPANARILVSLAEVELKKGDQEAAEVALARAVVSQSPDARLLALLKLGEMYREDGRHRDAFRCLAQANRLLPGEPRRLLEERYVMTAQEGDRAVRAALAQSREQLDAYSERKVTREQAHESCQRMRQELEEIIRFAQSLNPPRGLQQAHRERLAAYQQAQESTVDLLAYLDYNDESWKEFALEVAQQSLSALDRLAAQSGEAGS